MPERRNLRCDQNGSVIKIRPMILRDLSLYRFNHPELRRRKELLHRFFKHVDAIHAVHQDHLRLVHTYVVEDTVDAAGVDVMLV